MHRRIRMELPSRVAWNTVGVVIGRPYPGGPRWERDASPIGWSHQTGEAIKWAGARQRALNGLRKYHVYTGGSKVEFTARQVPRVGRAFGAHGARVAQAVVRAESLAKRCPSHLELRFEQQQRERAHGRLPRRARLHGQAIRGRARRRERLLRGVVIRHRRCHFGALALASFVPLRVLDGRLGHSNRAVCAIGLGGNRSGAVHDGWVGEARRGMGDVTSRARSGPARLCLCDAAWSIAHANRLHKYKRGVSYDSKRAASHHVGD